MWYDDLVINRLQAGSHVATITRPCIDQVVTAPVEVSSTAAALLRACGPHFEKQLQVGTRVDAPHVVATVIGDSGDPEVLGYHRDMAVFIVLKVLTGTIRYLSTGCSSGSCLITLVV